MYSIQPSRNMKRGESIYAYVIPGTFVKERVALPKTPISTL